jgi:hypothetical protein
MDSTQETKIHFASLMGKMGKAFNFTPDKETLSVYFEFLADRSLYQVDRAITEIIRSGDRFPTVSKIRELAGSFREFKTVEVNHDHLIEEFSGADQKPQTAEDFFRIVGELVGEKGI